MPRTDAAIRKAKPREKPRKLYDSRGLYLEIAPRGTKAWRFKYRFAGKEKRISMGIYPEVSLKLARRRRDEARKLLARDIDPSAYRKAQKQSKRQWAKNSFEAVAGEWLAKHAPNWSPGHGRRLEREFARNVFALHRGEAGRGTHATGALGGSPPRRGARPPEYGAQRPSDLRRVLRYAVATGRAERDVSWDLRGALPPVRKKHFAAITDPKEVGPLLRMLDGYVGTLPVRCALRLAPLVFVRPGELIKAEWAGIDLDGSEWRYTVTKTDTQHMVPLARQAVAILRELHPLTGHHRYVFPNARYPHRERAMSHGTPVERVPGVGHSEGPDDVARVPGDGAHDSGRGAGLPGPTSSSTRLAHAVRDPNGRAYNRTKFLPERRVMMQAWADYLDRLRAGEEIEPGTYAPGLSGIRDRNTDSRLDVSGS